MGLLDSLGNLAPLLGPALRGYTQGQVQGEQAKINYNQQQRGNEFKDRQLGLQEQGLDIDRLKLLHEANKATRDSKDRILELKIRAATDGLNHFRDPQKAADYDFQAAELRKHGMVVPTALEMQQQLADWLTKAGGDKEPGDFPAPRLLQKIAAQDQATAAQPQEQQGYPTPPQDFNGTYDTRLTPEEEKGYQLWKLQNAPHDSGQDYDLRGAFRAGATPSVENGHFPDTFKKPNHPTFSNESRYAIYGNPGSWQGEKYVPGEHTNGQVPLLDILGQLQEVPGLRDPIQALLRGVDIQQITGPQQEGVQVVPSSAPAPGFVPQPPKTAADIARTRADTKKTGLESERLETRAPYEEKDIQAGIHQKEGAAAASFATAAATPSRVKIASGQAEADKEYKRALVGIQQTANGIKAYQAHTGRMQAETGAANVASEKALRAQQIEHLKAQIIESQAKNPDRQAYIKGLVTNAWTKDITNDVVGNPGIIDTLEKELKLPKGALPRNPAVPSTVQGASVPTNRPKAPTPNTAKINQALKGYDSKEVDAVRYYLDKPKEMFKKFLGNIGNPQDREKVTRIFGLLSKANGG